MLRWLISLHLFLQISGASRLASSASSRSLAAITEEERLRMYKDELYCEQMALSDPVYARLA